MIDITQHNFYWFVIGCVVVVYLIDWAVDWIWFQLSIGTSLTPTGSFGNGMPIIGTK